MGWQVIQSASALAASCMLATAAAGQVAEGTGQNSNVVTPSPDRASDQHPDVVTPDKQLIVLASGQNWALAGKTFVARTSVKAVAVTSPGIVTIAIVDGELSDGRVVARAGDAFVVPHDARENRRFAFDAARLAATLRPEFANVLSAPLDVIATKQRAARFWGRLTPVGVNATSSDPQGAATAGLADVSVNSWRDEAEALRLGLALTPRATLAARTAGEQALLTAMLRSTDDRRMFQMAWFLAGATAGLGRDGANEAWLYNPLAEGWIVLGWALESGRWRVATARTLLAREVPDWTKAQTGYLGALATSAVAAQPTASADATSDQLFGRVDRWIGGLADWSLDPARNGAVTRLRAAIAEGRAARFGQGGRMIDALPAAVRRTFTAVTGFRRASGGGSVLLMSALYPSLVIAADFDAGSVPKPMALTIINLTNGKRRGIS